MDAKREAMAKAASIRIGREFWLPCEVSGGPFPDERIVYVQTKLGEWVGFVNESELEKKVQKGDDRVRGVVLSVREDVVVIGIQGQSPQGRPLQAERNTLLHGAV
jgi:hypothetical protein